MTFAPKMRLRSAYTEQTCVVTQAVAHGIAVEWEDGTVAVLGPREIQIHQFEEVR